MNDAEYEELFEFLQKKIYPKKVSDVTDLKQRKNAKHKFRDFAKRYNLENGFIYHSGKKVIRRSEVKQLLYTMHDNESVGCHLGRDKTTEKLCSRYFWKGE